MRPVDRVLVLGLLFVIVSMVARGQEPTFRSSTDTVRAYATVTNRTGRLVTDLSREDFDLRVDGVSRPITVFDNTPVRIRLIVLLDISCSMRANLPLMRHGAALLLSRLAPEDKARVATFGGETLTLSPAFTNEFQALAGALPGEVKRCGTTPLWPAIATVMDAFGPTSGDERRVVVVFSDGADSNSKTRDVDVIDRARRDAIMVYGITMLGLEDTKSSATEAHKAFTTLAAESGGGFTELNNRRDISGAFGRVADELRSQYLLGFEPAERDGRVHRIDVKSKQSGLKVRARRSFVAPSD